VINNQFAEESPAKDLRSSLFLFFQAISFIHCDHSRTNRFNTGHDHYCKFWSSSQDMELDTVALRLRSSKRVKLVLPNHSSRRSVSFIANNIHFRKPSNEFSYPWCNCTQRYNNKKWSWHVSFIHCPAKKSNRLQCLPQTHLSSEGDIPVVGPRESKPVQAG
jgi:hypothetical protein